MIFSAFIALMSVAYVGSSSTLIMAQAVIDQAPHIQETMVEWAIKQGGALVVLVIVLYFYRRDYHVVTDFWKDQNRQLTELVISSTKAQTDTANALRENNIIVHQAKNVMAKYLTREDDILPTR